MVHQNILKVYVKCHISSFSKSYKIWDICVVLNSNLQYGTSKVCTWNVTFQVFVQKLKNWEHLCCHELKFAIWYIKTVWKFTWNVTFQVFLKKVTKLGPFVLSWTPICNMVHQSIFESLREMLHFKFSWKKQMKLGTFVLS